MNTTIIVALIPYVIPSILIIAGYVVHILSVYIPSQQRAYIQQFAEAAVAFVEQQCAGQSDEQKQQLALLQIKAFFKAFNLPLPPDAILIAFIEAAVQALSNAIPVTVVQKPV